MTPRLVPLDAVLRLNTRLVENCFDGVDQALALERPGPRTNHMSFLACHLVDARFHLAALLGAKETYPFANQLAEVESIEEIDRFPPLAEILAAWRRGGAILGERFRSLSDEALDEPCPVDFPIDSPSQLGAIAFLLQHESFHAGQLALVRKHLGLEAVSYPEAEEPS